MINHKKKYKKKSKLTNPNLFLKYKPNTINYNHNHNLLSFNLDLLIHLSSISPSALLLYIYLRRIARYRHGNFSPIIPTLSLHQKTLLKKLISLNLITPNHQIINHRTISLTHYSNRFVKLPNSIKTIAQLKSFILAATESFILKKRIYSYTKNTDNILKDQSKGNTIKTIPSARYLRKFISYQGKVYNQHLSTSINCSKSTISRRRKNSPNKYSTGQPFIPSYYEYSSTHYSNFFLCFIKYIPKTVTTKIECFYLPFNKRIYNNQLFKIAI